VSSFAERWYGASMISEDPGGTTVPFEKVRRIGSREEWVQWNLEREAVMAILYNGGESCEMELLLSFGKLNGLHLKYSETGVLEKVQMSLVVFMCLSGNRALAEMASMMLDDGSDIDIVIEPLTGKVRTSWDVDGVVDEPQEGLFDKDSVVSMVLEMSDGKELCMEFETDGNFVNVSIESVQGEDIDFWEMSVGRFIDAGAFGDISSPEKANDYLFGELVTMPIGI